MPDLSVSRVVLAAALVATVSGVGANAQTTLAQDFWAVDVEAAVSREREARGLASVQSSEALRNAAQAQAEDMAGRGYFALEAPAGAPTLEWLLDKEGYRYTLLTEKLVRVPLTQTVAGLAAGWRATPEANRASLFLDGVHEVGVGVAEGRDARIVTIVLAAADGTAAAESTAAAFTTLARDPAAAQQKLCDGIAAQRSAWGLTPLRVDASLGEAAATHAKELLAALLANRPTSDVVSLADLVAAQRARGAPLETSGEVSRQRRHASRGTNTLGSSVGQVIVTDASSPEEALATALRQGSSDLRDPRYRVVAVGLAVRPPASLDEAGRSVWVVALATH